MKKISDILFWIACAIGVIALPILVADILFTMSTVHIVAMVLSVVEALAMLGWITIIWLQGDLEE